MSNDPIGRSIAHYRLTAKLGEGGMGEVYRASDTKLKRDVAIKLLPPAFTEDPERLARFEREAQLLAQLHHPNIASIFGIEESDGTRALIMELVEGPTLAERLEHGPLPFNECLFVSLQIAQALEEAHEKGIVHRDLKPQNVKASIEGKVKVLDFGLAKAMDPVSPAGMSSLDLAHSPTLTLGATVQGVILGTAAYMAPEQARGVTVDKRADIWAFGVVLYEMLSGRRLFEGELVTDVLASVLTKSIDLDALPPAVPPAIRRLLRRCLERNPRNRLHDIADARLVIEEALLPGRAVEDTERPMAEVPSSRSWRRRAPLAVVLVALGGVGGWLAHSSAPAPEAAPTFSLRRLTDLPGFESSPDLSPDGRQLVYTSAASGNKDLYVMRVEGGSAIDVTASSPVDDEQAAFSPDGERLVFRSSRDGGGLFVMGATGESVRRLTDEGFDPAWSPDGRRVVYSMEAVIEPYRRSLDAALWIVDVATGEKKKLPPVDAVQPVWSPDGQRIAYWANAAGQRDLWTVAVSGGAPVAVTHDAPTDWSPEWSPDGRWLYFSSDRSGGMNLFRVRIDPETGGAAGSPEQVTTSVGSLGWFRFSADGMRLIAAEYELSAVLELYRLVLGSEPRLEPLRTLRPRTLQWCRLSPDAQWIACSTIGTPEDLVLLRADGSELRRLTDDVAKDRSPSWSFDGSHLSFYSTRAGAWAFWSIRADGSELRQLNEFFDTGPVATWRPDGRRITTTFEGRGIVDLDSSRLTTLAELRATPLPAGVSRFVPDCWSPSGRLLGGTQFDGTRALSIGAIDWAGGIYRSSQLPISGIGFRRFAGWLPDSRRFVAVGSGFLALVDIETGAYRELLPADPSKQLFPSLSADGGTLLVGTPTEDGDLWLLESEARQETKK